ncbi:uncharacterized protein J3D65DRAFT_79596 [Phyllosticta citribraziliensis]|uniref:Uncharacterized protein n=1 Tax=Phyllosticta citribraziliensis TaxID=989973 RepID=A0ABR1LFE1_9PEZI
MNRPQSNGLYTHPNTHVRVDSGRPVASSWLNGQGALVFGGATGAGAAVVKALAEAGAYVTIADSAANEGQRLMLECVGRNLRVQYIYTNLPVFRSQAEAMHYAAVFSPTATVSVVVCSAVPPPTTPQSPHLSLLSWLRTTTSDSVFPNPIPAPPTSPLDRAFTATYHAVHHALHHFRQSPPLIPLQQQRVNGHGHQQLQSLHRNGSSTSPKSATSSTRSHVANASPTSFKTAGTSTSAPPSHVPPPPPPPALPLDPSTALHAHPVRCRENGEMSTSPTVPTGPMGALRLPTLPSPVAPSGTGAEEDDLTALPTTLPPPSPPSPAGALDDSMHTLTLMATLPPNERKHLVVLAPDAYLDDEDVDTGTPADDTYSPSVYDASDGPARGARSSKNKLPPQQLAERAAAAGLRALVDGLTELCETDAVGPGISVGCVGWGDERPEELDKNGNGVDGDGADALLTNAADRRCVRGVMRLLCGNVDKTAAARAADIDDNTNDSALPPLTTAAPGAGALTTLSPPLPALSIPLSNPNPSPTLLSAASTTDVEADADDEASGDFDVLDEDDALLDDDDAALLVDADSSSSTSADLVLAARSVAPSPLDRPSPSAGARGSKPALGQLREEDGEDGEEDGEDGERVRERKADGKEEEGVSALPPLASKLPDPADAKVESPQPSQPSQPSQPQNKAAHQNPTTDPAAVAGG